MHLPYYTEILILRTANMGSAQALSAPPTPKRLRTRLYGVYRDDRLGEAHKESSANRVNKDESKFQKLLSCFTSSLMRDPCSSDAGVELHFTQV